MIYSFTNSVHGILQIQHVFFTKFSIKHWKFTGLGVLDNYKEDSLRVLSRPVLSKKFIEIDSLFMTTSLVIPNEKIGRMDIKHVYPWFTALRYFQWCLQRIKWLLTSLRQKEATVLSWENATGPAFKEPGKGEEDTQYTGCLTATQGRLSQSRKPHWPRKRMCTPSHYFVNLLSQDCLTFLGLVPAKWNPPSCESSEVQVKSLHLADSSGGKLEWQKELALKV